MTQTAITALEELGYFNLREIPGRGICGTHRFIFTVGLCYGIDSVGYEGRYCFENMADAKEALMIWDGVSDPDGDWIKHKGRGGEYPNPNK